MNTELLRFLSVSVLPIIVLWIWYLVLKRERQKRITNQEKNDKDNRQK